jgi:hypothetical protein
MAVAGPATAAVILTDDFNRSEASTVGNGWTETENDSNDVAIDNNRLMLRDEIDGTIDAAASRTSGISTVGYTDIVLSYKWARLRGSDTEDVLHVQWRAGPAGTWQDVATHTLGGSGNPFRTEDVSLGALAEGVADFELRFWTDVSDEDEGAYIDNVVLSGTLPAESARTSSVPEPGTLALLGLGLAGIVAVRRRRSASPTSPLA